MWQKIHSKPSIPNESTKVSVYISQSAQSGKVKSLVKLLFPCMTPSQLWWSCQFRYSNTDYLCFELRLKHVTDTHNRSLAWLGAQPRFPQLLEQCHSTELSCYPRNCLYDSGHVLWQPFPGKEVGFHMPVRNRSVRNTMNLYKNFTGLMLIDYYM